LEVNQPLAAVAKSQLEEEKYKFMLYGAIVSVSVLVAFIVLIKYLSPQKTQHKEEIKKKRN